MRHRHSYDNRYCNGCRCTTRHEVKESVYVCLRCGTRKYPSKASKPAHSGGYSLSA